MSSFKTALSLPPSFWTLCLPVSIFSLSLSLVIKSNPQFLLTFTLIFVSRFKATWGRTSDYFTQKESQKTQQKREILIAITEQSKKRTSRIIQQNIQKMENNIVEDGGFLTGLNKREELRKSCFPSLLDTPSIQDVQFRSTRRRKADSFYKGTTYFMPEDQPS